MITVGRRVVRACLGNKCNAFFFGNEDRVGTCPICGSERSGFFISDAHLFRHIDMYEVIPEDIPDPSLRSEIEKVYEVRDGMYWRRKDEN